MTTTTMTTSRVDKKFVLLLLSILPCVTCFQSLRTTRGGPKVTTTTPKTSSIGTLLPPLLRASKTDAGLHESHQGNVVESSWESLVSTESDPTEALTEMLENLQHDDDPDLAFLFVSQFHASSFPDIVPKAAAQLDCPMLSVVGSGVIGENVELDEPSKPSMSLLVGYHLPPDAVEVFDFNTLHKPPPEPNSPYWKNHLADNNDDASSSSSSYLIFGDPWSPVENVTAALGHHAVVAGGISMPTGVGSTVARNDKPLPQGSLVGVRFQKDMKLQVVTAQGCRPIHETPFTITAAEGSCILELDGEPALKVMERIADSADGPLKGLVCGIQAEVTDDDDDERSRAEIHSDDYLIRQIVGFLPTKAGIAVAGRVYPGERLRFHVRDREAAEQDLGLMLQRARTERTVFGTRGRFVCAFQVSCVARGQNFFGTPNVDLDQTRSLLGDDDDDNNGGGNDDAGGPVAGFYAGGEIGPVGLAGFTEGGDDNVVGGSGSHIHGFTTVVAYLCDTSCVTAEKDNNSEPQTVLSPLADDPSAWG